MNDTTTDKTAKFEEITLEQMLSAETHFSRVITITDPTKFMIFQTKRVRELSSLASDDPDTQTVFTLLDTIDQYERMLKKWHAIAQAQDRRLAKVRKLLQQPLDEDEE